MQRNSGFTFIELMLVLLVISIMSAIAVPLWINWLPSYRLQSANQDLFSAFQKAKLEAVRRNDDVVLSFDPDNDGALADVYIMFVDNGNGGGGIANDFIQNGSELLLESFNVPDNITLVSTTFGGKNAAGFNSRGLPINNVSGTVNLSNTSGKSVSVRLSMAGHIRAVK
jgi:type IV fimbrial biogenesis protein FimT